MCLWPWRFLVATDRTSRRRSRRVPPFLRPYFQSRFLQRSRGVVSVQGRNCHTVTMRAQHPTTSGLPARSVIQVSAPRHDGLSGSCTHGVNGAVPASATKPSPQSPPLDPHTATWLGTDAHLPGVPDAHWQPHALRTRFAARPSWTPEICSEPSLRTTASGSTAWAQGSQAGRTAYRRAAVLVPLVMREVPTVLLTQRSATLSTHPGQIAFPGGRCDPDDRDAIATALREAHEEIGLSPEAVQVIGQLPQYATGTAYLVTPVVALLPTPLPPLHPCPDEVAEVFEVPLPFLLDPANHHRYRHQWQGQTRHWFAMPGRDTGGVHRHIWGATAGMLRNLYRFLLA